jgi:hypothetical protein
MHRCSSDRAWIEGIIAEPCRYLLHHGAGVAATAMSRSASAQYLLSATRTQSLIGLGKKARSSTSRMLSVKVLGQSMKGRAEARCHRRHSMTRRISYFGSVPSSARSSGASSSIIKRAVNRGRASSRPRVVHSQLKASGCGRNSRCHCRNAGLSSRSYVPRVEINFRKGFWNYII